ncbi:hypothetical protein HU200_045306 [Digitaria exilis]|uniref:PB1 domain-containing protein n=1 Tax=Digitaria exilis TaxID=1010633 RepID=A0A835B077_9POAL|nr:hypothetical protein HU200_045306 [Digitaria exilis]
MAAEASHQASAADGPNTMKLLCSHGGRFITPRAHDGAIRYAGGETRVLVVPRDVTFRDLTRKLQEMIGGGAEVLAIRHRLADDGLEDDDVLVSVTCDEELAHMRAEHDRLLATRPAARFRVFVTTAAPAASVVGSGGGGGVVRRGRSPAAAKVGLPPLAPKMRRAQSEQASLHRRGVYYYPAPVRRVQSAQEFAGRLHAQQSFYHHQHQQCCCQCRDLRAPAPPAAASPINAVPYMSKKVAAAPSTPAAAATGRAVCDDAGREKAKSRDSQAAAMEDRRAIWEFE